MITSPEWLKETLMYSGVASFGGLIGHLMREQGKTTFKLTLLETVGAGFAGYLVMQLCVALGTPEIWIGIIVGVSGLIGTKATIGVLERFVRQRLGIGDKEDKS